MWMLKCNLFKCNVLSASLLQSSVSHDPCYLFVYIRWVWHVNVFSVCVSGTRLCICSRRIRRCVFRSRRTDTDWRSFRRSWRIRSAARTHSRRRTGLSVCVWCVSDTSVYGVWRAHSLSLCVSGWVSSRSQSWALRWRSCRELYRSRTARPRTSVTHTHSLKTDSSRHDCVWAKITPFSPQTLSAAVWWTICLI